jgi:hypothetical protein
MLLLLSNSNFHIQNIYFLEKKINMIMEGFFTKLIFTTPFMTMNGLFFQFPIQPTVINHFLQFDTMSHKDIIYRLSLIEKQLIQYYFMFYGINKTPVYTLKNQLQKGSVKYYRDICSTPYISAQGESTEVRKTDFYIKISGIWENQYEAGITFKIIEYGRI